MLKGPRLCLNLHGSIIAIFFEQSEKISARLFADILTRDDKYSLSVKASV